ncbi:protein-L-isoaspartate O-methyltransferase [Dongia sp.]|jgi:protein-L-isoaspartate(D-aspartate) O-methyltransferase|uniref:protein-L-isoaspartate O-methyltransferase family protein n=1 Tax=Dongia sp. TaxID=1977262 RepID=UPI0035B42CA8
MATAATMNLAAKDYAAARRFMVDGQIRTNKVTDERLVEALSDLPRERFVAPGLQSRAYIDDDLPIGNGRHLMEPMVQARLIQTLYVQPGDKVLVVGAAGGYTAALLGRLGASVTALESDAALAETARAALAGLRDRLTVNVVTGALKDGHAQSGPFNGILLEGAVAEVPARLIEQLKQGGKLVTVLRDSEASVGRAVLMTRADAGAAATRILFDANTPLLPGFERAPSFAF